MEQIRGLVPVDPHATEIVSQKVVQRVSRKKAEAVWNPIGLAWHIVIIRLGTLSEIADRLGALLVCSRPDA